MKQWPSRWRRLFWHCVWRKITLGSATTTCPRWEFLQAACSLFVRSESFMSVDQGRAIRFMNGHSCILNLSFGRKMHNLSRSLTESQEPFSSVAMHAACNCFLLSIGFFQYIILAQQFYQNLCNQCRNWSDLTCIFLLVSYCFDVMLCFLGMSFFYNKLESFVNDISCWEIGVTNLTNFFLCTLIHTTYFV